MIKRIAVHMLHTKLNCTTEEIRFSVVTADWVGKGYGPSTYPYSN
jgi:hypothetical protein